MKAANYRYLKFISFLDNHSSRNKKLTKVTDSVVERGRSYRGLIFFAGSGLQVLEAIGQGEYMAFGMQEKDIRQHLKKSIQTINLFLY